MNPGLLADAFDNIPGDLIDTGDRMLKPVTNYIGTYVNMWERIFEEKPMRLSARHEQVGRRRSPLPRRYFQAVDLGVLPAEQTVQRRDTSSAAAT